MSVHVLAQEALSDYVHHKILDVLCICFSLLKSFISYDSVINRVCPSEVSYRKIQILCNLLYSFNIKIILIWAFDYFTCSGVSQMLCFIEKYAFPCIISTYTATRNYYFFLYLVYLHLHIEPVSPISPKKIYSIYFIYILYSIITTAFFDPPIGDCIFQFSETFSQNFFILAKVKKEKKKSSCWQSFKIGRLVRLLNTAYVD